MLRLLSVLCLALGATGSAWAACGSTQAASVASGGSAAFTCSTFGFQSPAVTAPSHGSLTFNVPTIGAVTYTNNGDGALLDTFVLKDFDTDSNVTFTITVGPASLLTVSPASLPTPSVGVAYSQALSTSGGTAPYTYSLASGSLPPGLSLSSSGVISGTSTQSGPHNFTVHVVDSTPVTALTVDKSYSISIPAPTLDLSPDAPPNGVITVPHNLTFVGSGGTAPYTFSIEAGLGDLPPGLSMSSAGVVSGTPTATGSYTFSLRLDDNTTISTGGEHFIAQNVTITIDPPPTITVSPSSLPAATVGSAYSQTVSGGGGTAPYTFAVTAGALPAGLALNATSGALTGTPTAGGTFNFTVTATDANSFTGSRAYSLTVNAPTISVTPTTLPSASVGSAYSQSISASGGTASYTFAITAGALPAGMSLNSGGSLAGTPTAGGTFNFTVTATDSSTGTGPYTGSRAYSLTVAAATISVSPTSLPDATQDSAYSQSLGASGGTASYTFAITAGALPAGLSLSSSGALSGTPTVNGSFNFTVTATDSSTGTGPFTGSRAYTLTVASPSPPVANPVSATVGFNSGANPITLNITGGVPTSVAVASAASNGTAIASGTSITYQPNTDFVGSDSFTYIATNAGGTSAPATVTITVSGPPVPVANAVSATVAHNSGANPITLNITGGTPTSVAVATAPTNGTVIASGTSITYQPDAGYAGADSFTYTASNLGGTSAPATVSITVSAPTIVLAPASLPNGVAGTAYSQTFSASGGTSPYTFSLVSGALPIGMSLSSAGVFSGTPSVSGTFNFTVRATDANGFTGDQAYSLVIASPTIAIAPASLPDATAGFAYSQTFTGSGGAAPYSFSLVSGGLPIGMSMSSAGAFSGTPVSAGTYNFTVRATDTNGFTGDHAYSLVVVAPTITLSPASLPNATEGVAYSQTFTGSGGAAPYSFSLVSGALPIGLSMSSAGVFSGIPASSGTYTFTVRATDVNGFTGDRAYTLSVIVPTLVIAPATLPNVIAGTAYSQTFTTSGGIGPYSYSLVSGALPIGMSLSSAGVFGGTPAMTGAYTFTLRSSDSGSSATIDQSYTLTVVSPTLTMTPAAGALPAGTAGTAYMQAFAASGGAAPYTYALVSGGLPGGLSLGSDGALSGTPTTAGDFSFSVRATDSTAGTAATVTQAYTLSIQAPAITVNPPTLPGAIHGVPYTHVINAVGGTQPYTYAITDGALPAGVTLSSSGTISGAPTATGSFAFTVTATDALGFIGARSYTVQAAQRPDPTHDPEARGQLNAQVDAARRFASAQVDNFQQHLQNLHDARGGGRFSNGLTFTTSRHCLDAMGRKPGDDCNLVASNAGGGGYSSAGPDAGERDANGSAFGAWVGGVIRSGNQDGRGGGEGIDFESDGISAGLDYRLSPAFAFGGGVGYGRDDNDIGDNGSRVEGDAYTLALYGSYHPGDTFFLDGLLGYQRLSYDVSRFVSASGALVQGSRDGSQWFASISTGAQVRNGAFQFTPYARFDFARATLDGYVERGDPIYSLAYGDQDVDTTTGNVGVRFEFRHDTGWGAFAPQLRLEYQHDFKADSSLTMHYADLLTGPVYRADLDGFDRNRLMLGLGAVFYLPRDLGLRLEYRGLFTNDGSDDDAVMFNLEKRY